MISYEDAVKKVLENTQVLNTERRPVLESAGQVSAENVSSDFDLPQTDISGPDGYAVKSSDLKGAGRDAPVALRIVGTARAGRVTTKVVKSGTAVRIMTGSVIPDGADCVVRFEDTDEPGNKNGPNRNNPSMAKIYVEAAPGTGIRPSGSNVKKGTMVLSKGMLMGPAQISALLSIGKTKVTVIRRPVVTVIATGDELISPDKQLSPGKTYNCNAAAIASLVTHYGGIPRILGVARDNEASILEKIQKGMASDAIITSGGVSQGDYDLVRFILGKVGTIIFSRIKMGPGAAVVFGSIKRPPVKGRNAGIPVFALAGPPAGCLINFETLVRPALLRMRGLTQVDHPAVEATAADTTANNGGIPFVKWTYLEEIDGKYRVVINAPENTGGLTSIASANSLTIIPEQSLVRAGDTIRVLPLDWRRYQSRINWTFI